MRKKPTKSTPPKQTRNVKIKDGLTATILFTDGSCRSFNFASAKDVDGNAAYVIAFEQSSGDIISINMASVVTIDLSKLPA